MGCDIHGTLEKKIDDRWTMIRVFGFDKHIHFRDRNYPRFSHLACVRGEGNNKEKGLPEDVSKGTMHWVDYIGEDGHSHSYMDVGKASKIFVLTEWDQERDYYKNYPLSHYFGMDEECDERPYNINDYRIVFWFDN